MDDQPRQLYIGRGIKSTTVNICDKNNRRGDYDWRVRIFRPQDVTEAEIEARGPLVNEQAIVDLVHWLETAKHREIEKRPPQPIGAPIERPSKNQEQNLTPRQPPEEQNLTPRQPPDAATAPRKVTNSRIVGYKGSYEIRSGLRPSAGNHSGKPR